MSFSTGTPKRNRNPDFYSNENRTRKINWIEFGGATIEQGFKLVRVFPISRIKDGNVLIAGPNLKDMKVGSKHALGIIVDIGGSELVQDIENAYVLFLGQFLCFIKGIYDKNPCGRNLWLLINKIEIKSFEILGKLLNRLFKAEISKIERIQTSFFIDKANPIKKF